MFRIFSFILVAAVLGCRDPQASNSEKSDTKPGETNTQTTPQNTETDDHGGGKDGGGNSGGDSGDHGSGGSGGHCGLNLFDLDAKTKWTLDASLDDALYIHPAWGKKPEVLGKPGVLCLCICPQGADDCSELKNPLTIKMAMVNDDGTESTHPLPEIKINKVEHGIYALSNLYLTMDMDHILRIDTTTDTGSKASAGILLNKDESYEFNFDHEEDTR